MEIIESIDVAQATGNHKVAPTVVTIGNFDGCHRGHQTLIAKTIEVARLHGFRSCVITFVPRPQEFFRKTTEKTLFTLSQKIQAFSELGLDACLLQKFDQSFSVLTPEQFLKQFLISHLNVRSIVVGSNFRFGAHRQGDCQWLQQQSSSLGITLFGIPDLIYQQQVLSSTWVRHCISEMGAMAQVKQMLHRPYMLEGVVVHGKKIGHQQLVATANILPNDQLFPKSGVYAARVVVHSEVDQVGRVFDPTHAQQYHDGIVHIGVRPTVSDSQEIVCEVHILSKLSNPDLYGKKLGIYFESRIRDEKKFASVERLKDQIEIDIKKCKSALLPRP